MSGKFIAFFMVLGLSVSICLAVSGCKNSGLMPTKQKGENGVLSDIEIAENIDEVGSGYLYAVTVKGPLKGNYLLVDCRSEEQFRQGTIPAAVSLFGIKDEIEDNLPADNSTELIFFCEDSDCDVDARAATLALEQGYENVGILQDGVKGWRKAGFFLTADSDASPAETEN